MAVILIDDLVKNDRHGSILKLLSASAKPRNHFGVGHI